MPFFAGIGQPMTTVVDTGSAGLLRIDPDQLDGAIAVFQDALSAVEAEVGRARAELDARPLANDQVSKDVAQAFNKVGYQNEDAAVKAWEGAVEQLRSIGEQLTAARRTIQRADTVNIGNFQVL